MAEKLEGLKNKSPVKRRKTAGQPPHKPTKALRERVTMFARIGVSHEDIARVMKLAPNTLTKHYQDELDNSALEANGAIGGKLYAKAMDGDVACLIFWAKCKMGWSERQPEAGPGLQNGVIFMPVVSADQWALAAAPAQAALQKEAKD